MTKINIKKLFDVSDKVILIIGGAGLLGEQYAEGFCQADSKVILADIDFRKCQKITNRLQKQYNKTILPIQLDITKKRSIQQMIKKIVSKYGKIDVLINNAVDQGNKNSRTTRFEDLNIEDWNRAISVNLTGVFLCCQEVGKVMLKQKEGSIINISSTYGLVAPDQRIYGKSGQNAAIFYSATKSSILNLTRYLASYWRKTGIRVNTLTPGGVEKGQDQEFIKNYEEKTMIGRMARKDEYVGAMIFLASDASSYMTGSNLIVDGGWTAW